MFDKEPREFGLIFKRIEHQRLGAQCNLAVSHGNRGRYPDLLTIQCSLPKELIRFKNPNDGFFSAARYDGNLDLTFFNVKNIIRLVTLCKNDVALGEFFNAVVSTRCGQKCSDIKGRDGSGSQMSLPLPERLLTKG